jgi:hypothetical protein
MRGVGAFGVPAATPLASALLLPGQIIAAIPRHLAGNSMLAIDLSLEHLAKAGGHHQCPARGRISVERVTLPRELSLTMGDGQLRRRLGRARPRPSAAPGVLGAVTDRRNTDICSVVIEAHVLGRPRARGIGRHRRGAWWGRHRSRLRRRGNRWRRWLRLARSERKDQTR